MKIAIISFALFCALQSCKAQTKENINTKKEIMLHYPTVNKNFETFDEYQAKYDKIQGKEIGAIEEFLNDGTYVEINGSGDVKHYLETPPNSYFTIVKLYYKNGNIQQKGLNFNGSAFEKGIWYHFNEQGQFLREENCDQGFDFTFEDVLQFCEQEKIRVDIGPILQSTGFHTRIYREYLHTLDKYIWKIEHLKKMDLIETITLNGKTGEILGKTEAEYINN